MRIVVQEWERVLLYRDGRFEETLEAGRHRRFRRRRRTVRIVVRPRLVPVPAQEILTADGLSVKLSLTATCRTHDPRTWHEAVEDPEAFLYSAIQVGLRDAVVTRTLESLIGDRHQVGVEVLTAAATAAAQIGVTLDSVAVRDVMVPAEVRRAAAELATTRSQGLAALERARSEVAATRALVNAAKVFADNPALLQLRTLQAVEAGGATVVLNGPTVNSHAAN
ncbi:MAG: hypothetical protein QOF57_2268 [Frankiaceae bacterium]|nr:hypothetical protein [Frankiaceae bacterium]